jgi:hypothetical protein
MLESSPSLQPSGGANADKVVSMHKLPPTEGNMDKLIEQTIEIPHALAGIVIGRQGSTVQELERTSGARITVFERAFFFPLRSNSTIRHRTSFQVQKETFGEKRAIHIVGTARSCAVASTMIRGLVSDASRRGESDVKHVAPPVVSDVALGCCDLPLHAAPGHRRSEGIASSTSHRIAGRYGPRIQVSGRGC